MLQTIKKVLRRSRLVAVSAVIALSVGMAGVVASSATSSQTASAASCDKVNIIYCGLGGSNLNGYISSLKNYYSSNKSGHKSSPTVKKDYTDVQKVFNHFGATKSVVNGMNSSNTKIGTLYRNGDIKVDGKTVGTGAEVSARFSVPGSKAISGTNVHVRKTTSSFANDKVTVIVHFKNDKMTFAVMVNCGNVVKAKAKEVKKPAPKPKPKPSKGVCEKLDLTIVNRDKREVSAKVTGSTENAKIVGYKIEWGNGKSSSKQSDSHTYTSYGKFTVKGSVHVEFADKSKKWVTADKCKKSVEFKKPAPQPKQALECVELKSTPVKNKLDEFTFTAKGEAKNGASITDYTFNFGDDSEPRTTTSTTTHRYTAPGSYTATVHVNGQVDGKDVSRTAAKCKVQVKVKEEPKKQALVCVGLTAASTDNEREFTFTAKGNTVEGATVTSYTFDFGDDSDPRTVDSSALEANTTYTYAEAGNYFAKVTVNGTANGQPVSVTNAKCATQVSIEVPPVEEEPCPIPGKEHLPKDSEDCVADEEELCPIPGKEHLPKDSDECVEDAVVEDEEEVLGKEIELPKTGAAGAVALFSGISALGALGHRLFTRRNS